MEEHPFIIVGIDNCERCLRLADKLPNAEMVKIPSCALGLGDSIAFLTYKLNIPECQGCKLRRSILNEWFPYKKRASRRVRDVRNAVIKMGHVDLPVLLSHDYSKVYNIEEHVPGFK